MSRKSTRLTVRDLYDLGHGDENFCDWDFSVISGSLYDDFFAVLPNVLYKKVVRARFSIDLSNRKTLTQDDKKVVSESIFSKVHRYHARLIKVLTRVFPKAKTLKSVELNSIPIVKRCVELWDSLAATKSLITLKIVGTHILDADFNHLLSAIPHGQFKSIGFIECELTPAVMPQLIDFLTDDRATRPSHPIQFDLHGNHLDQEKLDELLAGPGDEEEEADEDDDGLRDRIADIPAALSDPDPWEENEHLRGELLAILQEIGFAYVGDDVAIVGAEAETDAPLIQEASPAGAV
jgi:hypothetical protein